MYEQIYEKVHSFENSHKVYFQTSQFENIIGWISPGFELYAIFSQLESKATCIKTCNKILNWIKEEENDYFIKNYGFWNILS